MTESKNWNQKFIQKTWKFLTSFQLGIPIMVIVTCLSIWGTIVESQYDAATAKKIVYDSWMMWATMTMLCVNLLAVVIDRWPWKVTHYPFVTVHFGIIILVIGGWITSKYGLDGSMAIPIGGQSNLVTVPPTDFIAYATYDGDRYSKIFETEVDFWKNRPTEQNPFVARLEDGYELKITKYYPYARISKRVVSVEPLKTSAKDIDEKNQHGSSVKIQLSNANVKQIESLTQEKKSRPAQVNLGPLAVYLGHDTKANGRRNIAMNEVYFTSLDRDFVQYELYRGNEAKPFDVQKIQIGNVVKTPWMGLEIQLIDYLQYAKEEWDVKEKERPTDLTTAAVFVEYRDTKQWLLLNDVMKLFSDTVAFIVSYQNRRIDLGFPIKLNKFEVTRYQGTTKAMEYASRVHVGKIQPDTKEKIFPGNEIVISMNEPLKHAGYTFYQSSFKEDDNTGEPVLSVLSVNRDPGRWTKYFGSLILSIGIVWLFVQRRKRRTAI